jgi:hypothetical protein
MEQDETAGEKTAENQANGQPSAAMPGESHDAASRRGELSTGALIRLLNIPTLHDMRVMESKLDAINGRVTALTSKIERIQGMLSSLTQENYLERVDFQLADMRTLMKRVLPFVVGSADILKKELAEIDAQEKNLKVKKKTLAAKEDSAPATDSAVSAPAPDSTATTAKPEAEEIKNG